MTVFYNEIEPYCVAWLEQLCRRDVIDCGVVDGRSIESLRPGDLSGVREAHFFAGCGGWAIATRLCAYGNAVAPPLAADKLRCVMEVVA